MGQCNDCRADGQKDKYIKETERLTDRKTRRLVGLDKDDLDPYTAPHI